MEEYAVGYNAVLSVFTLSSCDDDLDFQQSSPFTVEVMPYGDKIANGQTVELRFEIRPEGNYTNTMYTTRYFQYDGEGTLKLVDGPVLVNNDRELLEGKSFRLNYTAKSADALFLGVLSYNIGPGTVQKSSVYKNFGVATAASSSPTPLTAATKASSTKASTPAASPSSPPSTSRTDKNRQIRPVKSLIWRLILVSTNLPKRDCTSVYDHNVGVLDYFFERLAVNFDGIPKVFLVTVYHIENVLCLVVMCVTSTDLALDMIGRFFLEAEHRSWTFFSMDSIEIAISYIVEDHVHSHICDIIVKDLLGDSRLDFDSVA